MPGLLIVNPRAGRAGPSVEELCHGAKGLSVDVHVLAPAEDAARRGPGERPAVPQERLARPLRAPRPPPGTRAAAPPRVCPAARTRLLARRPGPVGLTIDGRPVAARVVLVANNHYRLELFSLGERERLDEGLLHLYIAQGWLPRSWEERTGERFEVDARAGRLGAAVDGEPEELETPLDFRIEPGALRLLLPRS